MSWEEQLSSANDHGVIVSGVHFDNAMLMEIYWLQAQGDHVQAEKVIMNHIRDHAHEVMFRSYIPRHVVTLERIRLIREDHDG